MQKDVTQGKSYCLTVYSVPCKVTAIGKDNIEYTLLNISETGQYLFIAPTWKVNISQDDASIVETFNLAGTGKVGRSGSGSNPTYGFLKIIFVDALPPISEAKENTLYFVPKDGTAPDNYDEYIFDPVNQQFELVGQSAIDTSDFAKLSSTNIFLAPNTFDEIITFKKGLKVSESGPVITSNDTTLNLPNTSTPLLKAQDLILTGVSTFNNEIRVPTIAGLTSIPIKVTSAVDFTSNSDTNFSGNINTPSINITDLITTPSGKIQTNDLGEFTIGLTNSSPTIADNGAHKFAVTDINKTAISLSHKIVKNGIWSRGWVIPTDLWDFTYSTDAELTVRTPTKNNQAANKLYVDTSISAISQFDSSSNQIISGTWEFSKPLKIAEAQLANEAVSKGYVDTNLSSKVDSTDVYTKTEIDNNYATKTEVADIKATADAAAPQATTYTKDEINTSLSNIVKITGDQTIAGVKTFTDNIKVPSPIAINDAASKDYVDALVDSVPLFNPAEAQTITGAYDFQDGLTRTTKDSPSTTDIMNKEMSDNLYIPKTSNSDIGGIKTFTDGIILADEKQLQLGTGTDALKIHGTGTGKAVIEGTNASELDIAVPVNIQENAHISTLSTDVTGLGKTILFRFKNDTASQDDMVLYMYGTTSLVGIQGSTLGGGFNVAKQGRVTCENSLLVRGGANFQSGVTLGQTLTVTGIATFLAVPRCSISPTATNQLTNKNYVDETIQQNINTTLEGVIKFASMTEAEYKALEVKSPSTIYYLTDVPLWVIGDQEIVTSNMPA